MGVPKDLQGRLGQVEILETLGTTDPDEAEAMATRLRLKWRTRFRELRAEIAAEHLAKAPSIADRFIRALAERRHGDMDGAIYAVKMAIAYRLVLAWGPDEYRELELSQVFGGLPDDDAWPESSGDDSDIIPKPARAELARKMRLFRLPKAVADPDAHRVRADKTASACRWPPTLGERRNRHVLPNPAESPAKLAAAV